MSLCLHVCACSACAVIHKRVSYFYLSPSLPSSPSPLAPPPSSSLSAAASHICYAEHRQYQSSPTSLLSHTELTHELMKAAPSASLRFPVCFRAPLQPSIPTHSQLSPVMDQALARAAVAVPRHALAALQMT